MYPKNPAHRDEILHGCALTPDGVARLARIGRDETFARCVRLITFQALPTYTAFALEVDHSNTTVSQIHPDLAYLPREYLCAFWPPAYHTLRLLVRAILQSRIRAERFHVKFQQWARWYVDLYLLHTIVTGLPVEKLAFSYSNLRSLTIAIGHAGRYLGAHESYFRGLAAATSTFPGPDPNPGLRHFLTHCAHCLEEMELHWGVAARTHDKNPPGEGGRAFAEMIGLGFPPSGVAPSLGFP
ncbi:unnamed protein product [Parascedosporium putredinis]|uniref:Uncharacterized protein n=1 Tax=Parascedosporium putredinis TaxID=1442378 RepID=A0A9P1H2K8_9PEZI|nr:unnamed protein product [Parascedosporium putredinis]CAI7993674.1 unnamed protein product [Parascedosporium putredinis]